MANGLSVKAFENGATDSLRIIPRQTKRIRLVK